MDHGLCAACGSRKPDASTQGSGAEAEALGQMQGDATGNGADDWWVEYADEDGNPYWYNTHSGESTYYPPSEDHGAADADDLEDHEMCVVCMDAPAQVTLFPCGHNITCASCTRALISLKRPCPFCSAPIKTTDIERLPEAWRMA